MNKPKNKKDEDKHLALKLLLVAIVLIIIVLIIGLIYQFVTIKELKDAAGGKAYFLSSIKWYVF